VNPIGVLSLLDPSAIAAIGARRIPVMRSAQTSRQPIALEPDTYVPAAQQEALPQVTYGRGGGG